jgi:hypothetical protein
MGVLVCYDDFTYDVVTDHHLAYLLEKGGIIGYDNSGEWIKAEVFPPPPAKRVIDDGDSTSTR